MPTSFLEHTHMAMQVPNDYPLSGQLKLAMCKECDFVGNISPSGEEEYVNYYTDFNKHKSRDSDSMVRDTNYFNGLIEFMVSSTGSGLEGVSVLDYGSATGQFSSLARTAGAVQADNADVGIEMPTKEYNWIVSTHCFEHLIDPHRDIKALARQLAQEGHLLIAVPDLQRYPETYYGPWAHFDLEHINHFSFKSICALMESVGLNVVAHRSVDRLVGATLAYPEILVIGKRPAETDGTEFISGGKDIEHRLSSLIARYEDDLAQTLDAIDNILDIHRSKDPSGKTSVGFYGLSSFAFRIINVLSLERPNLKINFYADSDSRLKGLKMGAQIKIFDRDEYEEYVAAIVSQGGRVITLIAAINGYRILEALSLTQRPDEAMVVLLPPECQNRMEQHAVPK